MAYRAAIHYHCNPSPNFLTGQQISGNGLFAVDWRTWAGDNKQ